MLSINNNLMSANASRNMGIMFSKLSENTAKLSSGLRVNSADDDAAGLAIRELLRADIAVTKQASRNISDGISMAQTSEGVMGQMSEHLGRMKQLATQASNGTYSPMQKRIMQQEFTQLRDEIQRVANTTEFNGNKLLNQDGAVEIAAGEGQSIDVDTKDLRLDNLATLDLESDPEAAIAAVSGAIEDISAHRGNVGAEINRMEKAKEVQDIRAEMTLSAESRISDTDVASEVASMTKNMIVSQSGIAMQVHSQAVAQMSLQLLK